MNSSISRGWVERKRGLKHEELWTKHDPSVLSLSLSSYIPRFLIRNTAFPALYHAASTDSECAQCSQRLCMFHTVTLGAGHRPPRHLSRHISVSTRHLIKHTQACDVRCWTAYTGCVSLK